MSVFNSGSKSKSTNKYENQLVIKTNSDMYTHNSIENANYYYYSYTNNNEKYNIEMVGGIMEMIIKLMVIVLIKMW